MSNPNLQSDLKDNWVEREVVMPPDVNNWSQNINNLNKMMPVYASTGCFYTATFEENVYNLVPLSFEDNSQNVNPSSYLDGMVVEFKIPENNNGTCFINVNGLGQKSIKNIDNTDLVINQLNKDQYIKLRYNKTQDCFIIDTSSNVNRDLSNLTEKGEKHFLNKTQITNCILSAPNGVATFSGLNITLKQGLKMLYSNGRNIDKTLKNGELTLDSDSIIDLSAHSGQTFDFELMFGCNINDSYLSQNYQESDVAPTNISGGNQIYLNTTENQMYFYNLGSSSWDKKTFIKLGQGKLENGVITSFTPYQPVELLKRSDKVEISKWSHSSNKFDNITLASTAQDFITGSTYTLPANGVFVVGYTTATKNNAWLYLINYMNNNTTQQGASTGTGMNQNMRGKKGDVIFYSWFGAKAGAIEGKFIYDEGEL